MSLFSLEPHQRIKLFISTSHPMLQQNHLCISLLCTSAASVWLNALFPTVKSFRSYSMGLCACVCVSVFHQWWHSLKILMCLRELKDTNWSTVDLMHSPAYTVRRHITERCKWMHNLNKQVIMERKKVLLCSVNWFHFSFYQSADLTLLKGPRTG